jgi:hypothetical protein
MRYDNSRSQYDNANNGRGFFAFGIIWSHHAGTIEMRAAVCTPSPSNYGFHLPFNRCICAANNKTYGKFNPMQKQSTTTMAEETAHGIS